MKWHKRLSDQTFVLMDGRNKAADVFKRPHCGWAFMVFKNKEVKKGDGYFTKRYNFNSARKNAKEVYSNI